MNAAQLAATAIDREGACQDHWELEQLIRLLWDRTPLGLVLEIGCDRGGTLWLWRQLARHVVGVTMHTRSDGIFHNHGATVVTGDSTDKATRGWVAAVLDGAQPDLVLVDGDHHYATAMADIGWARQLAPRGLVVVHDIERTYDSIDTGPQGAWLRMSADTRTVEIIRQRKVSPGTGILFPGR